MSTKMPDFIPPMLAKLGQLPAADADWAFEVKWDGMRAIAAVQPGRLRLMNRTGRDITPGYPELAGIGRALGSHEAIIDGEIIATDEHGRPSFQALQPRIHLREPDAAQELAELSPVTYMVFDLMWLDGESLIRLPYSERRALLEGLDLDGERWHVPAFGRGDGARLLAMTRERQLEGVIAKPIDSPYLPGRRGYWVKIKNSQRQEVVIGGWTTGKGSRAGTLGALHLGVRDEDGALRYVGRVGTGFNAQNMATLLELLQPLARTASPFTGRQPAKGAHFVEPTLVCEVEFSEWTHAGTLRQASYRGLREDKSASEVVRERPDGGPPEPDGGSSDRGDAHDRPHADDPGSIGDLVAAGRTVRGGVEIEVEGRALKLTNLDKVLYPAAGFTKRDLISYYVAVSRRLLPHLHDRPLTLKRYPNGVDEKFFYEKRAPRSRPDWVQTVTVSSSRGTPDIPYTLCQDLPTLIWLANLAVIELHPSLSRADAIARPTTLAFDLDPGAPADIVHCCEVALLLRALLEEHHLTAFAKTSGSKGLQVYVPLNDRDAGYEQTKTFAHRVAELLEDRHPELVVSSMAKAKRHGKVLIDWSQNDEHKTTVSVYSLHATPRPSVSTPIAWEDVRDCRDRRDPQALVFDPGAVLQRIGQDDPFSAVLSMRQQIP